jgi:hypothetical protein
VDNYSPGSVAAQRAERHPTQKETGHAVKWNRTRFLNLKQEISLLVESQTGVSRFWAK